MLFRDPSCKWANLYIIVDSMSIKSFLRNRLPFTAVGFMLIIFLVFSCEKSDSDSFKLSNQTDQTTSVLPMTVEQSYLVDLSPTGTVSSGSIIISPGETETIYDDNIMGYKPGSDIQLYFYEVIGDSTFWSGSLLVTRNQLKQLRYHVMIEDKNLTKRKTR